MFTESEDEDEMTPEEFRKLLDDLIAQVAIDLEEGREDYSERLLTLRDQVIQVYSDTHEE